MSSQSYILKKSKVGIRTFVGKGLPEECLLIHFQQDFQLNLREHMDLYVKLAMKI